jgi:hypothetical protein
MGSPYVSRIEPKSTRPIPVQVQVAPNRGQPLADGSAPDVFDDNASRSELGDDPREVLPETGAPSADAATASSGGVRNVVTREAAADDVHRSKASSTSSGDVDDAPIRCRPVAREDGAPKRVPLDLPHHAADPGPLKPQLDTADP